MKKKKTIVTQTPLELAKAIGLTRSDALEWEELVNRAKDAKPKRYKTLGVSSDRLGISKMKTKLKK